jgi:hypothetical protein
VEERSKCKQGKFQRETNDCPNYFNTCIVHLLLFCDYNQQMHNCMTKADTTSYQISTIATSTKRTLYAATDTY